ncbi:MYND domain-containing protein [Purpureocillium lavendulum]|uniref:MYND-type zinc finger protein samB n=1 Tax=Purpureocillium lavendulum TaxID=1247861 RepID=A0AB34FGW5_9HYPO|nr:MYND domain-containing protein [Purpureocillium lavendulum]
MREVNFSIPNVNKASVGITTALYDRRALDCTSTLPLINSLNHLAYLTTSSARIRDILTVDGGIERLVCILKQGRSKDMMGMWKWNLAFQCVVNIGVRGTENVRTRVVEADMVPVIATILDNYIKVIEKCREKAEEASQKQLHDHHHRRHRGHDRSSPKTTSSFASRATRPDPDQRGVRRHGPPPSIDIPTSLAGPSSAGGQSGLEQATAGPAPPRGAVATPERPAMNPGRHRHSFRESSGRLPANITPAQLLQPLATPGQARDGMDTFVRPVRDVDRLASMAPFAPTDVASQPTSPTTPLPPPQLRSPTVRPTTNMDASNRQRRRPSIRHQNSTVETDDLNADSMPSDDSPDAEMTGTADIQSAVGIQDISMEDGESMLAGSSLELTNPTVSETHQDAGTFNITHRAPIDGSIGNNANPPPVAPMGLSPSRPTMVTPPQPTAPSSTVPRYLLDRHYTPNQHMITAMPREEDVLMSLQLLAYVSKYCGLRSYFQQSHLVPKLAIGKNLDLDGEEDGSDTEEIDSAADEEYLLPNDFNLFPLVEKFTVRYHSTDMQYWAGVVMRNLCRKDDTRGGIRQCAYYQCGKWEEYTRQFAKCRRCRRTKYCSKECQKSAWAFHRHWCVAASQ